MAPRLGSSPYSLGWTILLCATFLLCAHSGLLKFASRDGLDAKVVYGVRRSFPSSFCFVGFSKQAQPSIPTSHAQGEKRLSRRNTASAQRKYWRTKMAHFCSSSPEVIAAAAGAECSKPSPESCEHSTCMSCSPRTAICSPSIWPSRATVGSLSHWGQAVGQQTLPTSKGSSVPTVPAIVITGLTGFSRPSQGRTQPGRRSKPSSMLLNAL